MGLVVIAVASAWVAPWAWGSGAQAPGGGAAHGPMEAAQGPRGGGKILNPSQRKESLHNRQLLIMTLNYPSVRIQ